MESYVNHLLGKVAKLNLTTVVKELIRKDAMRIFPNLRDVYQMVQCYQIQVPSLFIRIQTLII